MKKVIGVVLVLLVLVGCSENRKESETESYVKNVLAYTKEIKTFGKDVQAIYKSTQNNEQKIKRVEEEAAQLKQKAEAFNESTHPSYLKHVHRAIVSQNYRLIDSLSAVLLLIRAGDVSLDALQKTTATIETSAIVKEIKAALKDI